MSKPIDLAEQQLLGYSHAKQGYGLRDLIIAMGLKKSEWETLKKNGDIAYLSKEEKAEIEEYFKE